MKTLSLVVLALSLLVSPILVHAEEMFLTFDDGREIVLHTSGSWKFKVYRVGSGLREDIPVTLDDGSSIMVRKNGTWGFVERKSSGTRIVSDLDEARAVGNAQCPVLSEALAQAMSEAVGQLADQLIKTSSLTAADHDIVRACIDNEEKSVETKHQTGQVASATVKLGLDREGIMAVLRCVEENRGKTNQQ